MQKRFLLILIIASAFSLSFFTTNAYALGTAADTPIVNAISPTGGTLPLNAGELSIAYTLGNDSSYADTSTSITLNVDTAYDMELMDSGVGWEAYFKKADTVPAGETSVFSVWIRNDGNISYPINFYHKYASDSVFINYLVFRDVNGDNQFDIANDAPAITSYNLAADASGTFFFVVTTYDTSPNASQGFSTGVITDSAPVGYGSTSGDGWQDGNPLGGSDDTEDTFIFTFRTYILGPLMRLSKTVVDSSGLRPGDTVQYQIIYDNDGGDSANDLIIVDAIPQYTSWVVGSWTDSDPHNGTIDVGFAASLGQDTFADAEATTIAKVRWRMLTPVGPNKTDNTSQVNYNPGENDDGRIRFTIKID